MNRLPLFFFLVIGLLFVSVCSQAPPPLPPPPEAKDIHQLQFVFRWPATYCKDATKKCTVPSPEKFTLVRFAATNSDGEPFENCRNDAGNKWQNNVFTRQVQGKLKEFWPPLDGEKPQDMWTRAWMTHGTCSAKLMSTPDKYFDNAIKFSENVLKNLLKNRLIEKDGIVPCDSVSYTNAQIQSSFMTAAKGNGVSYNCKIVGNVLYLHEVTFCYNTKFTAFEKCPQDETCDKIVIPRP